MGTNSLRHAAELNRRLFVCLRLTSVTAVCWHCVVVLLADTRPIPEASLAAAVGCPRTTLREHTTRLVKVGYAIRTAKGLILTKIGAYILGTHVEETLLIVSGLQQGYSDATMLRILLFMPRSKRKSMIEPLKKLSFSPPISVRQRLKRLVMA